MENKDELTVIPYFCHEGEMNRLERVNKRQFFLILLLILALIGSNFAWIMYEKQFVDVVTETSETVDVDTTDGGTAIGFIGDMNEVDYGEGESN